MNAITIDESTSGVEQDSAPQSHQIYDRIQQNPIDEADDPNSPVEEKRAAKSFSYKSLSSLLRVLGAGVLVTSLSTFLFQGWAGGDDIYRFAVLIGFSGVLALAGLTSSHIIRENIGARLFLGIALLSVVVNFAVAGGLVFSGYHLGQTVADYPDFIRWEVATGWSALLAVFGAIVVLAPVAVMGFRALARRSSATLVNLFLLANATLLIPIRNSEIIVLIAGVLTVFLINRLAKAGRADSALSTMEGRFAQALVLTPALVMIGRLLFVYSPTVVVLSGLCGLMFIAFRQINAGLECSTPIAKILDFGSAFAAFGTALGLTSVVADIWPAAEALSLPVFSLVFAGMLVELSVRTVLNGALLRRIASILVALAISTNLYLFPSVITALTSMCVGLAIITYGFSAQQKMIFAGGIASLLLGFGYQLWLAIAYFEFGSWSSLAVLGTITILLASVLERHGLILRERVGQLRTEVDAWSA